MNTFVTQPFNALLIPPPGWQAVELLTLNYSVAYDALNELVSLSGICHAYDNPHDLTKHIWVFLHKDRFTTPDCNPAYKLAALLLKHYHIFTVAAGATFHPKLTAILYENEDKTQQKLRLIVSSRNLTTENNLEAGIKLETTVFDPQKLDAALLGLLHTAFLKGKCADAKGSSAAPISCLLQADFIQWCADHCRVAMCILQADFSQWCADHGFEGVEFLTPQYYKSPSRSAAYNDLRALLDSAAQGCTRFVAVSPFLNSASYLRKLLPANGRWTLITSHQVVQGVYDDFAKSGDLNKLRCYAYPDGNSPHLHAKIYAFTTVDAQNTPVHHLLLGSANFSHNGLERNYELDVHIVSKQPKHDFCTMLAKFLLPGGVVPAAATTPPAGHAIAQPPAASDDALWAEIQKAADNDQLRQYFAAVLQGDSNKPYALDYAVESLREANTRDEKLNADIYAEWKARYNSKDMMHLPPKLHHYEVELGKLIDALN